MPTINNGLLNGCAITFLYKMPVVTCRDHASKTRDTGCNLSLYYLFRSVLLSRLKMQALQNPSTLYSKVLGRTSFFIRGLRNGGFCLCTRKRWAAKGP